MSIHELPDDPSIDSSAPLWRRIPPWHIVSDNTRKVLRIASAAFDDDPEDGDPMSVLLGDEVLASGRSARSVLHGHDQFGMVSISASVPRTKLLRVARTHQDQDPAHASVLGKKTGSVKKSLVAGSAWVVAPPRSLLREKANQSADLRAHLGDRDEYEILEPRPSDEAKAQ